MKRARFSEEQIIGVLREAEAGAKVTELCRRHAISDAMRQLGNTPAVCRKCYIHPAVLESYLEGSLQIKRINVCNRQTAGIWAIERELIHFLESRRRAKRSEAMLKAKL